MPANSKLKTKSSNLVTALLAWFASDARDLPWRRTRDPYAIWVSEIMLQQTQVKTVIPFWERWLRELPDIAVLAAAPPEKIHKLWEGLGYYTRVRNMQKAAQQILTTHAGKFPRDFDAVLALTGIGRYTAGAICSIAFNQPTPLLDGNVIRVLTRVFGISENPKAKATNARLWQLAEELVTYAKQIEPRSPRPTPHASHLNQSLMELGALICTPRNPRCDICPVKKLCIARRDGLVEQLPNLDKRAAATARHFVAFIVERNGKFLVRQRPAGVVNAHLWEFPNEELLGAPVSHRRVLKSNSPQPASETPALRGCDFSLTSQQPVYTVRHSITRYRITLAAYRAEPLPRKKPAGIWRTLAELDQLAFTSAHRKVLAHLNLR